MTNFLKRIPVLGLGLTLCISVGAQTVKDSVRHQGDTGITDSLVILTDSSAAEKPKTSHLEMGMSYQSNDVYLGRKDSSLLPYYIPELTYFHKSGLYATASLNYLKNSTISRIDLVTLEGGYIFTKGNYDGQLSFSKYFYNSQSTSVTSEISSSLAYQSGFDFGFIKTTFTGTLNFGNKTDFAGLLGLEHSFYLLDDRMDITPTFAMAASTQNYYSDYYKKRRYTIKRGDKAGQTAVANISGTIVNASQFKILDYEPTMPINYRIGKCVINFTPTYSVPVNPATIDIQTTKPNGTVTDSSRIEKISNTFYWTLGCSFLF
jgi:hypothetical protein